MYFPAMWIQTFLKSTFLFGENFQVFTLHWQKGGGRGTQSDDRNSFIVSSVLLFSGSFSLPMHINASEQHFHLFPLFLIYIYFLVTDGSGVRLKLTFHIATFCGTGS